MILTGGKDVSQGSSFGLDGRVAIVTGGGRGIGRGIALALAEAGADVAIADIDLPNAEATAKEILALGRRALLVRVDVTDSQSIGAGVAEVLAKLGGVDILVNNAGVVQDNTDAVVTAEDFDRCYEVNLKGIWSMTSALVPHFAERGEGKIVNIASIAGKEGNPKLGPYSASKAGVIGMTKSLAKEVADTNVRIHSIAPAVIHTPMLDQVNQETIDYMVSKIPVGRTGTPDEVAALVHYLSSEESSFTTGACFDISGGRATY